MILKTKRIRLKGEKLRALNDAIHERDGHCCIICGAHVDPGEKFHHEPAGASKSDEITKGVTLCYTCHQQRHFGPDMWSIKKQIEQYLLNLYSDNDEQWR